MQQEVTIIEIDWSEASGGVVNAGSPYLFGWLRAYYVRPGLIADGRVVVVARADPAAEWLQYQGPVTESEAESLVIAFAILGVPERAPRVESTADPSDKWFTSSVRVVVEKQLQSFTVQAQSSGYQGPEADGLRAVFRRILDLSGYGQQPTLLGGSGER